MAANELLQNFLVKIVLTSGWAETLILGDDDADTHIYQYHVL